MSVVIDRLRYGIAYGDTLDGLCDGLFGDDSHDDKVVLHVGHDYVVAVEWQTRKKVLAQGPDVHARLAEHIRQGPPRGVCGTLR